MKIKNFRTLRLGERVIKSVDWFYTGSRWEPSENDDYEVSFGYAGDYIRPKHPEKNLDPNKQKVIEA